jgi:predicted ATPase
MTHDPFIGRGFAYRSSARGRRTLLRKWRLANFKSVRQADLTLHPLTLLVGANSAGKSSLIQSILAATQAANAVGDLFPLNGSTVRLGTVEQNRYAGPGAEPGDHIKLGATFELSAPYRPRTLTPRQMHQLRHQAGQITIDWNVELGEATETQSGRAEIAAVDFRVFVQPADGQQTLFDDEHPQASLAVKAQPRTASKTHGVAAGRPANERRPADFKGTATTLEDRWSVADVALRGGMPTSALVMKEKALVFWNAWRDAVDAMTLSDRGSRRESVDEASAIDRVVKDINWALDQHDEEDATTFGFEAIINADLRDRIASSDEPPFDANLLYSKAFMQKVISRLGQEGVTGQMPTRDELEGVTGPASWVLDYLRGSVRYLGPLREDPRVAYQDSPEAGMGYVGVKGEYCAAVLQNSGNRQVRVPIPDGRAPLTMSLNRAVNIWANYLEIGQSISATDIGRLGVQMEVNQEDVSIPLDLTSVGTGVSQILPVLVMCLEAPEGSLLMIEQPELHLNPRVQQRLADFLLAIAKSGRQLLVETHSEYLISRLRLRVAEDPGDSVRDHVGLLFAERINGKTVYRQVETNEYGGLDNWPHNFFDQSAEETHNILRAAVRKRRERQEE